MAAGAGYSGSADPRRADEFNRLPRRYGIRFGGAATEIIRALPERTRSQITVPGGDRRNAAWLADVPPADPSLRVRREGRGAKNAGAPGVRAETAAGCVQSDRG